MGKKKGASKGKKGRYNLYQLNDKAHTNRTLRLERHVKKHPHDKQSKKSLADGLATYRRYASHGVWTATHRFYAQLFVKAGLNGNDALPQKEFGKT